MDRVKFEMNSSGRTCLHVTVEWGHKEAMNYLIDKCGFDPNLQDAVRYILANDNPTYVYCAVVAQKCYIPTIPFAIYVRRKGIHASL